MRLVWIALAFVLAGCGARSDLEASAGGIPCGDAVCAFPDQLCARCDGPDDDGSFEMLCIDIPEFTPDWWGARYPGCDRPLGTIHCGTDDHCSEPGTRCITEGTDTFCAVP